MTCQMIDEHLYVIQDELFKENCYLLQSINDDEILIIDPGVDLAGIVDAIISIDKRPVGIVLTHAHYDHIASVGDLVDEHAIPSFINKIDEKLFYQANIYALALKLGKNINLPEKISTFSGDGEFSIGSFDIFHFHTPGHTPGSSCFIIEDYFFSGDTILPNGSGRVDFPGGNKDLLNDSIEKISKMNIEKLILPGHGAPMVSIDLEGYFT